MQLKSGVIANRRIDLLVDKQGALTSLPHELTHVVLADCFAGRQPPLWLDEGVAMLADTHDKQMLHERDYMDALSSKNALEAALHRHYQIDGVRELESQWKLEIKALKASTKRKQFVSVRFQL